MGNNRGNSLVEILTVIGIIALLATIAVPNFLGWRKDAHLRQAAQDLYSSFQSARLLAARRNAFCSIIFDGANSVAYTVFIDADADLALDASEEVIQRVNGEQYRGVLLDQAQGGGDGLTFNNPTDAIGFAPNGLSLNNLGAPAQGVVFLENNRKRLAVQVSTGGSISIFRP